MVLSRFLGVLTPTKEKNIQALLALRRLSMKIYRLSDVVGKKLAKDRNPFCLINDMGDLVNEVIFPILDANGNDTRSSYRNTKYLPLFSVAIPRQYPARDELSEFPRFSFRIYKTGLHVVRER